MPEQAFSLCRSERLTTRILHFQPWTKATVLQRPVLYVRRDYLLPLRRMLVGVIQSSRTFTDVAALTLFLASAHAQSGAAGIPTPTGLSSCKEDDPVATIEKRIATTRGAEYIACFRSDKTVALHTSSKTLDIPAVHAIAMSILGGPYSSDIIDTMLSTVREQWKNYDPLSDQHKDYLAFINAVILNRNLQSEAIESLKPVLVSIERLDDQSYMVVSIRDYAIVLNGDRVRYVKVSAAGIVLVGGRLLRLELQRQLLTPSDVDDVRKQMVAWSRAVSAKSI